MLAEHIFRAYDIRGVYPMELNEECMYMIAQAYAKRFAPRTVVMAKDVRVSGPALFEAAARGLTDHGVNVVDIGVTTSDMMYFAAAAYDYDGGIMISASHNPREYNGVKMMRRGAVPVSGDTGIYEIRDIVKGGYRYKASVPGERSARDIRDDYFKKCLSFIDASSLRPLHIVGNAMFGPVLQNVQALRLPLKLTMLNEIPDGTFPKGPPDPFLPENQREIKELIEKVKPDFGAAWDGDADRFFLFDEQGELVSGYFVTAFLGAYFAEKVPGAKIIHDTRLTWAVRDAVTAAGGVPLLNKVGHAFIKERMRAEDALFAGEMSGHFYFKDFFYADNGLIPFLLMLEIVAKSGKKVSALFAEYRKRYAIPPGEINTKLDSRETAEKVMAAIKERYHDAEIDTTDGVSVEYPDWRANIRSSNTEPLLRLNVEAKTVSLLQEKVEELTALIRS